jgi:hypothetical protein
LQLAFDAEMDLYTVAVPFRLLPGDQAQSFHFPQRADMHEIERRCMWRTILRMFQNSSDDQPKTDPRLRRRALPLVPWHHDAFLALVATIDVFRILASRVSERQKGPVVVLVHGIKFKVLDTLYQNIPVVIPMFSSGDGHYVPFTTVQSREFADAFVGSGSLTPKMPYRINFVCSQPGYETAQRPVLFALYRLERDNGVLFQSQLHKCFSLWQRFVIILDEAWDHDDAYECTDEDVPLKKFVETYRAFAERQRPVRNEVIDSHNAAAAIIHHECIKYFSDSRTARLDVEIEDVSKRIVEVDRQLQAEASGILADEESNDVFPSGSSSLMGNHAASDLDLDFPATNVNDGLNTSTQDRTGLEKWYALWGFEGTRWLLIALTVTLGHNFCSVQALPPSFEALLGTPNCYIA